MSAAYVRTPRTRIRFSHCFARPAYVGCFLALAGSVPGFDFGQALAQRSGAPLSAPLGTLQQPLPSVGEPFVIGPQLIGSTVMSKDYQLVGVVENLLMEDGAHRKLVIGLAGYLGFGEKDVVISSDGVKPESVNGQLRLQHFSDDQYGGSKQKLIVPMTLDEIASAQSFVTKEKEKTGVPSRNSGTPDDARGCEPRSSTESGGP